MSGQSSGGSGDGGGGGGNLTASFPDGQEPRRENSASTAFENSGTTNTQEQQMKEQLKQMEAQRRTPEPQGMDYTIGGTTEQAVHTSIEEQKEKEIRELQERLERRRSRQRGRSM